MIEISNVEVSGWESAIRGMRNPLNSWDKSDSVTCKGGSDFLDCKTISCGECPRLDDFGNTVYCIGRNDYDLMRRLAKAGSDHAKYRRMITVYADIVAPLYWWKEYDTYKVGTVANSCSTMHKIQAKEFTLDDFSHEHLDESRKFMISHNEESLDCYVTSKSLLELTCALLNQYRELFIETKDKSYWWQMIQLLPSSYNQRRTVQLNYEVLANMYKSRRLHKLDEWRTFCEWVESLPYSDLITGERSGADDN